LRTLKLNDYRRAKSSQCRRVFDAHCYILIRAFRYAPLRFYSNCLIYGHSKLISLISLHPFDLGDRCNWVVQKAPITAKQKANLTKESSRTVVGSFQVLGIEEPFSSMLCRDPFHLALNRKAFTGARLVLYPPKSLFDMNSRG
jgi:hypothetical protein